MGGALKTESVLIGGHTSAWSRWRIPVNSVDDSYSEKVWVLCCELSSDIPVGLQGPGSVMGAAIQLINLCIKKGKRQPNRKNKIDPGPN